MAKFRKSNTNNIKKKLKITKKMGFLLDNLKFIRYILYMRKLENIINAAMRASNPRLHGFKTIENKSTCTNMKKLGFKNLGRNADIIFVVSFKVLTIFINTRAINLSEIFLIKYYAEICQSENKKITDEEFNIWLKEVNNAKSYNYKNIG